MTYNKRQKAHWNVGKAEKGNRKAKEKAYTDAEIEEQLAEQDPSFRYHMTRRKRNLKAHLEYQINWYETTIARYEKEDRSGDFTSYLRMGLRRAKAKLVKFLATKS